MRHGKKIAHLGRKTPHRKYMLANMACSLIEHKSINTTVAKAKALRGYVEPLLTKSKEDTTHSRRVVFSYLNDKYAVTELFRNISGKIADRPGGYTRIIKIGKRQGDNAEMAMIELVDYNELLLTDKSKKAKSTRRRRGGGAKKQEAVTAIKDEAPSVVEDILEEDLVGEIVEKKEPNTEEVKAEPKVEAKEEKPKAAKKAEPKVEAKEEKPKAAKKAEPKAEAKEEKPKAAKKAEPKPEAKEEKPKAAKKAEPKADDKAKEDK